MVVLLLYFFYLCNKVANRLGRLQWEMLRQYTPRWRNYKILLVMNRKDFFVKKLVAVVKQVKTNTWL